MVFSRCILWPFAVWVYAFFITEWPDDALVPARMVPRLFFFLWRVSLSFFISHRITRCTVRKCVMSKKKKRCTVHVKELDIFLTMKVPEDTPAVLSLGKLCDDNGYSYEWINGQKPHLIKNGIRIIRNTQRTSFRSWFLAYQRVLPPVFPLQHPWHLQGRTLIIPRLPQAVNSTPHTSHFLDDSHLMTRTCVAQTQVWRAQCAFHIISCVILDALMLCVWFSATSPLSSSCCPLSLPSSCSST